MRNCINIKGNDQVFPYIIEYSKSNGNIFASNYKYTIKNDIIRFYNSDEYIYRDKNNWYIVKDKNGSINYIPTNENYEQFIQTSKLKVYLPTHSVNAYVKSIKYAITLNTWINGKKIELGSFIFKPTDTVAISTGTIKYGNNEYHEYIEFDIIDPFYLIYSEYWDKFRKEVCKEADKTNNTGSILYVSLFVIDEFEDNYSEYSGYSGGFSVFNIVDDTDYLKLDLSTSLSPLGFKFNININNVYNNFLEYLYETYGISTDSSNILLDIVIKSKNEIIVDPSTATHYNANETSGLLTQYISLNDLSDTNLIKAHFSDWSNFEEGFSIVGSLTIYKDDEEILSFVSNEVPINQEIFSMFTNNGSEKIIDILEDMEIKTYNVVNKIENKIVQIERPNESKSNIMQPVFFRVTETEMITLHPTVTENISINLDNYKAKVNTFILKVGDCMFNQIGSNGYGILFKITANSLPSTVVNGTYYILDENYELVTTGKYNCIR